MAWLYVPGLVESNSDWLLPSVPPIEPSVMSKGKPIAPVSWRRACKTAPWIPLLSGLTSPASMRAHGVALWISSLQATRASHSPLPGPAMAPPTRAISGHTLRASLENANQGSFFSKTCQGTCRLDCAKCAPIYEKWVTTWRQESLVRHKSALRTYASDSFSLLPTPTAADRCTVQISNVGGKPRPNLPYLARHNLWPTPTATDCAPLAMRSSLPPQPSHL